MTADEDEVEEHHDEHAPPTILKLDDCKTVRRLYGTFEDFYGHLVVKVMKGAVEQSEDALHSPLDSMLQSVKNILQLLEEWEMMQGDQPTGHS